jgi:tetraspanin-11
MERLLGSNLYVASAAILIATGLVVTIISFLGTLGAYREIRCMLVIFFVILFIIFIVMLVGGILGYIFRSEVDERMHTEMVASIKSYKEDSKVTDAWDSVQRNVSFYFHAFAFSLLCSSVVVTMKQLKSF